MYRWICIYIYIYDIILFSLFFFKYASSLCDYLFTLYRDVQQRPFVLQFLPSFVIAYYDVLYHHPESVDAITKVKWDRMLWYSLIMIVYVSNDRVTYVILLIHIDEKREKKTQEAFYINWECRKKKNVCYTDKNRV